MREAWRAKAERGPFASRRSRAVASVERRRLQLQLTLAFSARGGLRGWRARAADSVTWARPPGMRRRHSAYRAVSDSDSDARRPRSRARTQIASEDSGTDATATSLRTRCAAGWCRACWDRVPSEVARLRHMESGTVALPAMLKEPGHCDPDRRPTARGLARVCS